MRKSSIAVLIALCVTTFLVGCSWQVGGGQRSAIIEPTIGQQLIDLQKAKDSGAINESEYQAQKTKLLQSK